MPEYTAERAGRILNREKKALNGARLLLLGVAYKQDIDDSRESPALRVMEELMRRGAQVDYYDPYISRCLYRGEWRQGLEALTVEVLRGYDLAIVTTAHSCVDYKMVAEAGIPVFDCKNVMKSIESRANIEVL